MDWFTWDWRAPIPFMYAGRMHVHAAGHPLAATMGGRDDCVNVARHIASVKLGRWLDWEEVVLFEDDNPLNLVPENISVITRAELMRRTANQPNKVTLTCMVCGGPFDVSKAHAELRETCSLPCRGKHSQKFDVSKDELEVLVWQMPSSSLAALFEVSDTTIKNRCRSLGIAKPPRGYWTLVKMGMKHDDAIAQLLHRRIEET